MEREHAIVVIGSANMDMVVSADRFPRPGETILGRRFNMFPGGKGANQAVACARLGASVCFIAKMGNDWLRDELVIGLHSAGVTLDYLLVDANASTGVAVITVAESGQNQIVVVPGSNMKLTGEDVAQGRGVLGRAQVALLQLEIPLETVEKAVALAAAEGCLVMLNPAPAGPLSLPLLRQVDFLTPNEIEAEALTGVPVHDVASAERAGRVLIDQGVQNVILTLGARGALLVTRADARHFPARKVQAVDTTAAGDAFNGALAVMLAEGKPVEEAIVFANAAAAVAVTRPGAQASMPRREEVSPG